MKRLPRASQGVVIIEPVESDNNNKAFTIHVENKGRIMRGKVISVGEEGFSDFGAKIKIPCKTNDIVWFLVYEGGYDEGIIDGKRYIFALFKDIRAIE